MMAVGVPVQVRPEKSGVCVVDGTCTGATREEWCVCVVDGGGCTCTPTPINNTHTPFFSGRTCTGTINNTHTTLLWSHLYRYTYRHHQQHTHHSSLVAPVQVHPQPSTTHTPFLSG